MKIKFLADENLRRAIVVGLRRREPLVSFIQASEADVAGKDDFAVLEIVARHGCLLVSHDVRTMPKYFQSFIAERQSPGVFLIPQTLPLGSAIDELLLLWSASEAEDWVNQLRYLPI